MKTVVEDLTPPLSHINDINWTGADSRRAILALYYSLFFCWRIAQMLLRSYDFEERKCVSACDTYVK